MANVLSVVWIVIAYVVTQTSIMVWAAWMLPNPVERARQRLVRKPVGSFFLGLLFWSVTMLITSQLIRGDRPGVGQLIGWLLMGPMLAASVLGGAAFAQLIGGRISAQLKNDSPVPALIGGALCTVLAGLLPVIGWFVFLPITGMMAIGAGALGILSKRHVAEQPASAPPAASWPGYGTTPQPAIPSAAGSGASWPAYSEQQPGQGHS
jgi:hypothetical protein